jgi:hypothetical protein
MIVSSCSEEGSGDPDAEMSEFYSRTINARRARSIVPHVAHHLPSEMNRDALIRVAGIYYGAALQSVRDGGPSQVRKRRVQVSGEME